MDVCSRLRVLDFREALALPETIMDAWVGFFNRRAESRSERIEAAQPFEPTTETVTAAAVRLLAVEGD